MESDLDLDRQVCFALYSASRSLTALYRPLLGRLGLTYPQYLVMLVLWERGDISVKHLGETLMLDSGTLSPLLKRLESAGLVTRRRDPADERSVVVALTPSGTSLKQQASSIPRTIVKATGVPLRELLQLRDTAKAIAAAVSSTG